MATYPLDPRAARPTDGAILTIEGPPSPAAVIAPAADDFLRNGGGAFALQKLLGHTSLAITRVCVSRVATDLQDAHRRASLGDNLRVRRRS